MTPAPPHLTTGLIIACDWLPPAFGAVGQYQLARARAAAQAGRKVTIIGLGADPDSIETELHGGGLLRIVRLNAGGVNKANLLARASWALRQNLRLLGAMATALKAHSDAELLVTGSPPFFAYMALAFNIAWWKKPITYRMTDFYPETALAAGAPRYLKALTPFIGILRRSATALEVLGSCQERRLAEYGVRSELIRVERDPSPISFDGALPAPNPFGSRYVTLLYSGNLGVAHDVMTFAEAYKRHVTSGRNRMRLWINATGIRVDDLVAFCQTHKLPYHLSRPVPLCQLPALLLAADVHLVTLRKEFWGYVIPSKIYGCKQSGRPILYVGPSESDIHALLTDHPSSHSIRNGDIAGCASALDSLVDTLAARPATLPAHADI